MVKLTALAQLGRLLEQIGEVESALMPNELEMYRSLKQKYAEPVSVDPFDVTALEVMLRNIEVRKAYRMDPKKDSGRVIELPRSGDSKEE